MEDSKRFRVEGITREIIKPSSPSPDPNHQGSFKLSLLDQFNHQVYVPRIFFYKATCSPAGGGRGKEVNKSRSECLKSSLSITLTRFYPFAGRLKDPITITCNDDGVDYWEAHIVNCSLSDVLGKPDPKQLDLLFPGIDQSQDFTKCPLLLIQVSFFECGGMALGIKYNHKVADGSSLCSFINSWADSAIGNLNSDTPDFSASTIFPPTDSLLPSASPIHSIHNRPNVITARFVFGPSELADLQAKAASTNNPRPSRFEAVTAFVCKVVLLSQKESKPECKKPSVLAWAVNLRSKLQPSLPDNCFGNLVGRAVHEVGVDGTNMSILASHIRRGTIDICQDFIRALKEDESYPRILELQMRKKSLFDKMFAGAIQLFVMTSWCKLPFYEADFGWGKPLWVTFGGSHPAPYMMVLVDTRDGNGIEVILSLTEEEMTRFKSSQELKNCAAFNPSAFS